MEQGTLFNQYNELSLVRTYDSGRFGAHLARDKETWDIYYVKKYNYIAFDLPQFNLDTAVFIVPLSFLTEPQHKPLRTISREHHPILMTRQNYFDYFNPKFFSEELYNDDNFWQHPLVANINNCVYSDILFNLWIEAGSPNNCSRDRECHYNPALEPLNLLQFTNKFYPDKIKKVQKNMTSVKIDLSKTDYSVFK